MKTPKPENKKPHVRTADEFYQMVIDGRGDPPKEGRPPMEFVRPEIVAGILAGLANGMTTRGIAAKLNVDRFVIRRVSAKYGPSLTDTRKETARYLTDIANGYLDLAVEKEERLRENLELLDEISPDRLTLTAAMLLDKAAMLEGMATQKIEVTQGVSFEDAKKAIEEIKMKIASGKVIDA